MIEQIFIYCYGCLDYNKHHRDDKDYEAMSERFDSLTDAFNHLMEHRDHHMELRYEEYEEQD
jgi:hypothetical protein